MGVSGTQPYGTRRSTAARRAVADAVNRMPGAFTVDDLVAELRAAGGPSAVATVYRAVSAMVSAGHLERVGARDGAALFLRCPHSGAHHHHVVCDRCGSVATAQCPLEIPALAAGTADGFILTRHEIALYGLCPSCASAED